MSDTVTDPTDDARAWLSANPNDPAAVHVRAALDSAWRYERLSVELAAANPGTRVVLGTIGQDRRLVITAASRVTERRIAKCMNEICFATPEKP